MSLYTSLADAVATVTTDAGIFRQITQGADTLTVTTLGGPVWSLAKSIKYIKDTGDAAILEFTTQGNIELENLADAIAAISGGTDVALKSVANTFASDNTFSGVTNLNGNVSVGGIVVFSNNITVSNPATFNSDVFVPTVADPTLADTNLAVSVGALLAYAPKKPANLLLSAKGTAVLADDIRVNSHGGAFAGGSFDASIPFPNWITIVLKAPFVSGALRSVFGTTGAFTNSAWVVISASGIMSLLENAGSNEDVFGSVPTGALIIEISYNSDTRVFSAYADGALIGTATRTNTDVLSPITHVFGAWADGLNPLGLSVLRHSYLNFVPTDEERAGAIKGEGVGRLSYGGTFNTPHSAISGTSANFNRYDTTAAAINTTKGKIYRVRVSITSVTGPSTDLPGVVVAHGSSYYGVSSGICSPGFNEVYVTSEADFFDFASTVALAHNNTVWSNGNGSTTYTGTILEVAEVGKLAGFSPDNVTVRNRWIDDSGNDRHLLPTNGAKAHNPQPEQLRGDHAMYNAHDTTSFILGKLFTATASGTGEIAVAYGDWLSKIGRDNITVHVTPDIQQGTGYPTFANVTVSSVNGVTIRTFTLTSGTPVLYDDTRTNISVFWRE